MLNTKTDPRFYTALEQAVQSSSQGPINSGTLLQDKNLVLEKASSLLGYQTYLTQARSWKAARKSVPLAFEREVQVQANQAFSDGQALAAAALRTTKHLKVAGGLDRVLDTWIAGVKASGPVQIQDLWSDLANGPQARQLLKDEGLTDELWTSIDESMKKLDGRLVLQDGKLAGEVKLAGQEQVQHVVLTHSASGAPRSLDDLLRRGQFERMVEQFGQVGALPFDVVAGEPRDLEIADLILDGAILSVQSLAQHKRKLEDTGLATYTGHDPLLITALAGLLAIFIGDYLKAKYCKDGDDGAACTIGEILSILGFLALIFVVGYVVVKFMISLNSLNVLNLGLH